LVCDTVHASGHLSSEINAIYVVWSTDSAVKCPTAATTFKTTRHQNPEPNRYVHRRDNSNLRGFCVHTLSSHFFLFDIDCDFSSDYRRVAGVSICRT
jgi:hypothetical protein